MTISVRYWNYNAQTQVLLYSSALRSNQNSQVALTDFNSLLQNVLISFCQHIRFGIMPTYLLSEITYYIPTYLYVLNTSYIYLHITYLLRYLQKVKIVVSLIPLPSLKYLIAMTVTITVVVETRYSKCLMK